MLKVYLLIGVIVLLGRLIVCAKSYKRLKDDWKDLYTNTRIKVVMLTALAIIACILIWPLEIILISFRIKELR